MAYTGHRPILPQQSLTNWVNNATGEVGTYSTWSLQTTVHLFDGVPTVEDHVPGEGAMPNGYQLSRWYRGLQNESPMNLHKYVHGGQDAPYLWDRDHLLHRGVTSTSVFPAGYGHGDRVTAYSFLPPYEDRGVTSSVIHLSSHTFRAYGTKYAFTGPTQPLDYTNKGVTTTALADPGVTLADKPTGSTAAFQKTQEWFGVPSGKAL